MWEQNESFLRYKKKEWLKLGTWMGKSYIHSIFYKTAPQVNRKSQYLPLIIYDWLTDYPQENVVPLYFMVKYAQNRDFQFINYVHEKAKIF